MIRPLTLLFSLSTSLMAEITAVVHPEEKFDAGNTVVWTPLAQATWDRLNDFYGGKPVKVEPPNELIEKLNLFEWDSAKVMPQKGWKTWAGTATAKFLEQVNLEARQITGEPEDAFRLQQENPQAGAFFGLLDRELSFSRPFPRSLKEPMEFAEKAGKQKVHFFGVRGKGSGVFSVRVLSYLPAGKSHAVELLCSDPDETVLLYRPTDALDFATACGSLRAWRQEWDKRKASLKEDDPWLHAEDDLRIPYVKLDSTIDFKERLDALRVHPGGVPARISRFEQEVKFTLHERGAKVQAKTSAEDPFGGEPPETEKPVPRVFRYDAPFFVFLWRKGAEWPYFGAWVGDASAMEKWE
jgi:hypothetical protein